jgi:hypothetical protein
MRRATLVCKRLVFACLLASATAVVTHAQWLKVTLPDTPRTRDGKPNLSAPAPKTKGNRPDLSGIWWVPNHGIEGLADPPPKYLVNLAADLKPEDFPILPWADRLSKERAAEFGKDAPFARCLPLPVPTIFTEPLPFKILQTPALTAILFESQGRYRQIFTDGRPLPKDPQPTWLGYSVGKWERDTFTVETVGFNDHSWLDARGHPHTDALRVTERFRRPDFGHIELQATIDDPKAYSRPWTVTIPFELMPDTELLEQVCNENEKDVPHLVGK